MEKDPHREINSVSPRSRLAPWFSVLNCDLDGQRSMEPVPQAIQIYITMLENCCTKVSVETWNGTSLVFNIAAYVEGAFDAAEPHFLASGKRDSARLLADMFIEWSSAGGTRGAFALRGTIPYVSRFSAAFPT